MTKVLISGDREWKDRDYIFSTLDDIHRLIGISKVIEGCARGVDRICGWPCPEFEKKFSYPDGWAFSRGILRKHYPAKWDQYGRGAGPIRNQLMLKSEKPDLVLAFHPSIKTSKGTKDMVQRARKAGVDVWVFPTLEE